MERRSWIKKALKFASGNRQNGNMRGCAIFALGLIWSWAGQAQEKWGMVDAQGVMRVPERYEKMGRFRGDLAKGLTLPEFMPGLREMTIVRWLRKEREAVRAGEPLAEVELHDAALPVAAPQKGMLTKILIPENQTASPGNSMGVIRVLGVVGLFAEKQHEVGCPAIAGHQGTLTVVRWLKMEGDVVQAGEVIAEVRPETMKTTLNAPATGTLVKIILPEGTRATVGQAVAQFGLGRVSVQQGKDWFFADEQGNRIGSNRFDFLGDLEGGAAPARQGDLWGFVDAEGAGISKMEFAEARGIRGGMAAVRQGNLWGFVSMVEGKSKMGIAPHLSEVQDFSEGLAAVRDSGERPGDEEEKERTEDRSPENIALWEYVLPTGKTKIQPRFSAAGAFLDGRAAVRPHESFDYWILIDTRGNHKTTGSHRKLVLLGSRRMASLREEGWALMDFREQILPDPSARWLTLGPFQDERAPAKGADGKWGYVDLEGRWAIPATFERALPFRNGLAAVKSPGKAWGFIRPDGSWGIEPKFSRARSFSDGLAAVSTQGPVESEREPETEGPWE